MHLEGLAEAGRHHVDHPVELLAVDEGEFLAEGILDCASEGAVPVIGIDDYEDFAGFAAYGNVVTGRREGENDGGRSHGKESGNSIHIING